MTRTWVHTWKGSCIRGVRGLTQRVFDLDITDVRTPMIWISTCPLRMVLRQEGAMRHLAPLDVCPSQEFYPDVCRFRKKLKPMYGTLHGKQRVTQQLCNGDDHVWAFKECTATRMCMLILRIPCSVKLSGMLERCQVRRHLSETHH